MARTLLFMIIAGSWLLTSCRRGPGPDESTVRTPVHPDIIIYLVDTLRRDHLEVYGYDRATSPRLTEFAEGAVVFQRAYSTSGWTRPAVASLFTGLNPARHGAVTRANILSEEVTVLADHFR